MRQEKSYDFGGLSFTPQDITRILGSPAGRQLLSLLQKDGGVTLRAAIGAATAGRTEEAKALLSPIMETQEAQRLIAQINGGL